MSTQIDYLVTGATGALGGLVVRALIQEQGVAPECIGALTRRPDAAAELAAAGVQVRTADFDTPETLVAAFEGVGTLLIVSTNDLGAGRRLAQHLNAVSAAAASGVKHILYTSMPRPDTSHVTFAPDHAGTEDAIKASGIPYTILRNSWYAENLLASVPAALQQGVWANAAGDGKTAFLGRAEYASAAAAAMVNAEKFANQVFTLTGSQAFSNAEVAAKISEVTGRALQVLQVPLEAIVEGLIAHGFQEPIAHVFASFDQATGAGDLSDITEDFQTLTGRQPQSFDAWLASNSALFTAN